jgi:Ran GTPase-activating protein (RanGAP) involved in mRNA processing and transport
MSDESAVVSEYRSRFWISGWLTKQGKRIRSWKKRFFYLRGSVLEYYKNDQNINDSDLLGYINLTSKCIIRYVGEVQEVDIIEAEAYDSEEEDTEGEAGTTTAVTEKVKDDNSFPFKFYILDGERNLVMAALTYEDAREWIRVLRNCVNVETYFEEVKHHRLQIPLVPVVRLLIEEDTKDLIIKNEWVGGDQLKAMSNSVLKKNPVSIVRFAMIQCGLSDDNMITLGEGLGSNETIRELSLSSNRIGNNGVADLVDGLLLNVTLTRLNLSDNVIGDVGAVHIADLLMGTVSINAINLGLNHITGLGIRSISRSLQSNDLLIELELGNNHIGDDGCVFLAEGLRSNKKLRRLGLSYNNIGSDGLKELCEKGLVLNRTLAELDLTGNVFDKSGAEALFHTLKDHKSLTKIDCGSNTKLHVEGITTLAQTLKSRYLVSNLVLTRNLQQVEHISTWTF